ncbi:Carbohydrate-selective porin, OprB family [Pirellulimonas nuda]|uniref:Carbohydrate-selective porin, OprB family n=1 Tax=Pirellulimonas nuda TaxID=2528009 RepID=A0A518DED8_9BACT|nr:carbohydrate porin [Pirellulimonas nuda]QDU89839.1 Carbohydrate-selective porin, OprB family [Pirellulimonas nuda]
MTNRLSTRAALVLGGRGLIASALLLGAGSQARGSDGVNDIQFATSQWEASPQAVGTADPVSLASCDSQPCRCCCCPDPPGYGYCIHTELGDHLAQSLTSATEAMAAHGVTYLGQATQFYQGVASGGAEQTFDYGGKIDQFLILDSTKLGLWEGTTMTMHAETRFGEDVNFDAVGLAPVNGAMLYPQEGEHSTAITGLSLAQNLTEDLQATAGKFNGFDLFYSLYPQTGRGVNGFMNVSMIIPVSVARTVPLSFMGAGAMKMNGTQPQAGLIVFDNQSVATTSGFDDMFNNGANIMGFVRFFTDVADLPGSHFFSGIWSTGEYTSLDRTDFVFVPGQGIQSTPVGGAYTLLYIYEKALWMDGCNPKRNISVLSMWGLADQQTSPVGWSANVALQASGFRDSRPHDAVGIGYFHTGLSNDFVNLLSPVLDLRDVDGVELYYSAAISQSFQLTGDLQVIEPAIADNDTAVVVGLRGTVGF